MGLRSRLQAYRRCANAQQRPTSCYRYVRYLGWPLSSLIFSLPRAYALEKPTSLWGSLQTNNLLGHLELSHWLSPMYLEDHTLLPCMSTAARELVLDMFPVIPFYWPLIGLSWPPRGRPTPRFLSTMSSLVSQIRAFTRMVAVFNHLLSSWCMCSCKVYLRVTLFIRLIFLWRSRVKSWVVSYTSMGAYSAIAHVCSWSLTCVRQFPVIFAESTFVRYARLSRKSGKVSWRYPEKLRIS